jgi:hypothetical protein
VVTWDNDHGHLQEVNGFGPVSVPRLAELRLLAEGTRGESSRMKWEYIVREFSVEDSDKILLLEEFLNEVGRDGWELVSVATTPTAAFTHLLYLKRATKTVDLPIGGF